jgi:quercetin dioxygenase-like cupin family protein
MRFCEGRNGARRRTTPMLRIAIDPDAMIARHTHPGIESGDVVEGGTDLAIDGVGALNLKPGDGFQVPKETPHGGRNGSSRTVIVATNVVEKGKPLASPA